jgi:hypothetical protein
MVSLNIIRVHLVLSDENFVNVDFTSSSSTEVEYRKLKKKKTYTPVPSYT